MELSFEQVAWVLSKTPTESPSPENSQNSPQKPIKRRKGRVRWKCNGAGEGVVARGPLKGTRMICTASSLTAVKWAIVIIQDARLHCGF